jgi:ribonuclease HI
MPGVIQATFYSKGRQEVDLRYYRAASSPSPRFPALTRSLPICWTLPTLILNTPNGSSPISRSIEVILHPVILHHRVADALGIREGDEVSFSLKTSHPHGMTNNGYHHCFTKDDGDSNQSDSSYECHNYFNPEVAETWARDTNNDGLFVLKVSIDPRAPFDVAIDTRHVDCRHIFQGTVHCDNAGNFLCLTNGSHWKLSEQGPVFRAIKTCTDFRSTGMLIQVQGVTDYYNQEQEGAGCGYCISASNPLTCHVRASEQLVQGYRYLGTTSNLQEAIYCALIEALQWVVRLNFQTVWIMGTADTVFRQIQGSEPMEMTNSHQITLLRLKRQVQHLLDQARHLRIQFKFLSGSNHDTAAAMDLARRAIMERRNETWCHWSTINYQSQRNLVFGSSVAQQVSI